MIRLVGIEIVAEAQVHGVSFDLPEARQFLIEKLGMPADRFIVIGLVSHGEMDGSDRVIITARVPVLIDQSSGA